MNEQVTKQIVLAMQSLVALQLWHLGAIKVNLAKPFRLVSGNSSPIYVNCRQLISSPSFADLFTASARFICDYHGLHFDVVAGGETAGIPFAAFLARSFGCPMIYVRKTPKGHGTGNQIEGKLPRRGARVLLIEDLITDAQSKLIFIDTIRTCGARIDNVLVVFDRLQGGQAALERLSIKLFAITDMNIALEAGEEAGLLSCDDASSVRSYLADPRSWHREKGLAFSE